MGEKELLEELLLSQTLSSSELLTNKTERLILRSTALFWKNPLDREDFSFFGEIYEVDAWFVRVETD